MDTKGLQKEFINWCKSKNKSPKSEDETKLLFVAFMKEKHPEEYKQAMLKQQSQTQKALHGAKLNYFKSLKNQCAEDEEIVYYKKGGSVGCGCKKKENGGEVPSAKKGSAVEKFKAMKMQKAGKVRTKAELDKINKKSEKAYFNGTADHKVYDKKVEKKNCGSKIKKHQEGSVIAQFKMHRKGGSLNGIPFMLQGTPKEGLPTAPKAEDRYKNGIKDSVAHLGVPINTGVPVDSTYYGESIKQVSTPNRAKIRLHILFRYPPHNNDTIYTEIPEHTKRLSFLPPVLVIPRREVSYAKTPDFEILKRRFNTAWNLVK